MTGAPKPRPRSRPAGRRWRRTSPDRPSRWRPYACPAGQSGHECLAGAGADAVVTLVLTVHDRHPALAGRIQLHREDMSGRGRADVDVNGVGDPHARKIEERSRQLVCRELPAREFSLPTPGDPDRQHINEQSTPMRNLSYKPGAGPTRLKARSPAAAQYTRGERPGRRRSPTRSTWRLARA